MAEASGKWSVELYKADIEMDLRTRNMAGFQLLDIQDYPGQGSAYVGILDAFMDSKEIVEVPIAYLTQTFRMPRRKACLLTLLPMLVFSTVCALSLGPWSGVQLFGMTIFDFLDYFTSNILLPVAAVGVCLYVGYGLPKRFFFKEVSNEGTVKFRYAPLFFWFVRIVAPLMILAAFANKLFFE